MDTLCGIGLPELIILALIGFVVIGPERSREVALQAGRFLRGMMTSAWWKEFTQIAQAIRNLPTTLVRMSELEDAQAELARTVQDIDQVTRLTSTGDSPKTSQFTGSPPTDDPWGLRTISPQHTSDGDSHDR